MTIRRLDEAERTAALSQLPEWTHDPQRDSIHRRVTFVDFAAAFAFMTRIAIIAEKVDHHPEWTNVWNRIDIVLTTHDAGGLSQRDVALALAIDAIVA